MLPVLSLWPVFEDNSIVKELLQNLWISFVAQSFAFSNNNNNQLSLSRKNCTLMTASLLDILSRLYSESFLMSELTTLIKFPVASNNFCLSCGGQHLLETNIQLFLGSDNLSSS